MPFNRGVNVRTRTDSVNAVYTPGPSPDRVPSPIELAQLVPLRGTGSPEGVVTASIGREYINTAGGATATLWVKTSGTGNTGWTAK